MILPRRRDRRQRDVIRQGKRGDFVASTLARRERRRVPTVTSADLALLTASPASSRRDRAVDECAS